MLTIAKSRPDRYAEKIARINERQKEDSRASRDVGPLPAVGDSARRAATAPNFRAFCETYFAPAFKLAWSCDHQRVMAKIEDAVLRGQLSAFAMPRGSGKTTLARVAAVWAILHGHRRWVCLIGATEYHAVRLLDACKKDLTYNGLLRADFPESVYPVARLENEPRRCRGQLLDGEPTGIEWTENRVVMPTVPNSPASGAVISVAGLTGNIRGQVGNLRDGTVIRPDLVLIDDPQTKESANSPQQNRDRVELLQGDILGLAGPDVSIAGLMTCTVIRPGDMADIILDPTKTPEWRGERTKLVNAWPTDAAAWDEYRQRREASLAAGGTGAEATAYYREHRARMDAGADVSWPERHPPQFASALEFAHVLKWRDPHVFAAEFQNEPLAVQIHSSAQLSVEEITARLNRHERGVVPIDCTRVTAFIDVQQHLLYWLVAAWSDDFGGAVLDYGTFPEQHKRHFALRDARQTLALALPGTGFEGQIFGGLQAVVTELTARPWVRDDGTTLRLERCLIDANWGRSTDTVYQFCRQSPQGGVVLPAHGRYVGAASKPFADYPRRPGERVGLNWIVTTGTNQRAVRHVIYDVNFWKTFGYARLSTALGDAGALTLYGADGRAHDLLAEHLTAEYAIETSGRGRSVEEWRQRPDRPDNHWFDCLVGAMVAASMQGALLAGTTAGSGRTRRKVQLPQGRLVRRG